MTRSQYQMNQDTTPPSPPPQDQDTTPPYPRDQDTTPPSPQDQDTTSPSPQDQDTTPPSLPPGPGHNTSLRPRDYAQGGGTHPTGMHSCLSLHREKKIILKNTPLQLGQYFRVISSDV